VRLTGDKRLATLLAWAAGLACLLALAQRFRFGTDATDETFSIALPYRFVLGDRPFVDEISIQQTAGIVLYPFVWIFVKVTGGTTGLVLFVRAVHLLVFKGAAALSVHAAARRWLRHPSSAVAVSFVPFAYVPHSIPNVGYNVIGMSLLTAGTFLAAAGVAEPDARARTRLFFLAGLAEGIMSFAYPPMVAAALLSAPLVLALAPRRLASTLAFVAGGVAALGVIAPALAFGGVAGVRRSLNWGVHAGVTASSVHVKQLYEALRLTLPSFEVYALVALLAAGILRSRLLVAVVVSAVTLAFAYWFRDDSANAYGAIRTVTYTGLLGPAMILVARPDGAVARGVALVALPAFAAGAAAAYVSTQGVDAASLGLQASMVLFAVLAARALERAGADRTFAMLPAVALMAVLVTRAYDFVYRDAPLVALTETVPSGPFKGIRTTPDRAQLYAELLQITKAYDDPEGRLLVLYEWPGLYLFSRMRPSAHCVWQEYFGDQDGLLAYWRRYPKGKGIVVRVKGTPSGKIDGLVAPESRKIKETRHLVVYRDDG
jgi:hypothetical protein